MCRLQTNVCRYRRGRHNLVDQRGGWRITEYVMRSCAAGQWLAHGKRMLGNSCMYPLRDEVRAQVYEDGQYIARHNLYENCTIKVNDEDNTLEAVMGSELPLGRGGDAGLATDFILAVARCTTARVLFGEAA